MTRALLAAILLLPLATATTAAQRVPIDSVAVADTSVGHALRLRDGTTLVGRVVALTADSLRFSMEAGTVTVARTSVAELREFPASRIRNGRYWPENSNSTRLLFAATAFPLPKGEGYYSNIWLFIHNTAYGLSNRFSLGAGMSLIPGISITDNVFIVTPKYTVVNAPRTKFALGVLAGFAPGLDDDDDVGDAASSFGIMYGVGTTGSRDNNLSLGLGWGYVGSEVADRPVVMLGGQVRASRRLSFISENWFVPIDNDMEGVISYGIRFLGESLSVDLAFLTPTVEPFFPGIPWVGFSLRY